MFDLRPWFQNEKYTPMCQAIVSFAFGVLLSPWGSGLFFLVSFLLIWELLVYIFTWGDSRYWNPFVRGSLIMCSLLGWLIGRQASNLPPLEEGVPNMNWDRA